MLSSHEVPYGKVAVRCNDCKAEYFVGRRELRDGANANNGWFPCKECGSHSTTWDIEGRKE